MGHRRDLDKFIEETHASQRNIVFPDTVRNGRSVDIFFWRGSPNPTIVQRIAAWMFGLLFMTLGLQVFSMAVQERVQYGFSISLVIMLGMSLPFVLIGGKVFRNGFPRRAKPFEKSH